MGFRCSPELLYIPTAPLQRAITQVAFNAEGERLRR
jgi:hypothetical protein